jgi:hypothetical protein
VGDADLFVSNFEACVACCKPFPESPKGQGTSLLGFSSINTYLFIREGPGNRSNRELGRRDPASSGTTSLDSLDSQRKSYCTWACVCMCMLQDPGQAYPHNIKQRLGATSDAAIVYPQTLPDSSILSLYSTMYLSIHRGTLPFANAHALSQQLQCGNPKDHKLFPVVDFCGRPMSVKDAGRCPAHGPTAPPLLSLNSVPAVTLLQDIHASWLA